MSMMHWVGARDATARRHGLRGALVSLAAGALMHAGLVPAHAEALVSDWRTFRQGFDDQCTGETVLLDFRYRRVQLQEGDGTVRVQYNFLAEGTGLTTGDKYVASAT